MIKLEDICKEISFDEPSHTYTNNDGKILTSVTTAIHSYSKPFDETGVIAAMCAKRKGITKNEMLAEWKETNRISLVKGKNIHAQFENFLNTGKIEETPEKDIIEQLSNIKFD